MEQLVRMCEVKELVTVRTEPRVRSLLVAEKFGKRHDRVLNRIDKLIKELDFSVVANMNAKMLGGAQ